MEDSNESNQTPPPKKKTNGTGQPKMGGNYLGSFEDAPTQWLYALKVVYLLFGGQSQSLKYS